MSNREYKSCIQCILDTNDYPDITFDSNGVCNICKTYEKLNSLTVFSGTEGKKKLDELLIKIKKTGKNKEYDCILGISGGVDSTYLAYLAKQWNLKPLIIHVDSGWNSELAVNNIEQVLNKLDFDLYTHVIKWKEIMDCQLSFFKASVIDLDLPFDNTFIAILYSLAKKHKIKYILSGHNTVTEGWMPPNFTHYKLDAINIRKIHKKYGSEKLKDFKTIGPIKYWVYKKIFKIKMVSPLNYVEYNKDDVKKLLIEKLNWKDYGGKHFESIFTRFYQGYILPQKFNVHKIKSHLSTLVCSGQIKRDEAISLYQKDNYLNSALVAIDKEFFIKKMGLSEKEFNDYLRQPIKKHTDYSSYVNIINSLIKIKRCFVSKK